MYTNLSFTNNFLLAALGHDTHMVVTHKLLMDVSCLEINPADGHAFKID